MPEEKPKIASVWVFPNGMVVVFDQHKQQMPKYQGQWKHLEAKIRANIDNDTVIHRGDLTGNNWVGPGDLPCDP